MRKKKAATVVQQRQGLSQSEFARALGITQQRVSALVRMGQITPDCIYGDGSINASLAFEILKETLRPAVNGTQKEAVKTSGVGTYYGIRADHESLKLELTRMELGERKGELVPKALVKAILRHAATTAKQKLLAIPVHAAEEVMGATSIEETREILRRHVIEALTELSTPLPEGALAVEYDEAGVPQLVQGRAQEKRVKDPGVRKPAARSSTKKRASAAKSTRKQPSRRKS